MERFVVIVESIILDFSRKVNKVCDYSMMADIREAYDILSKNKLLSHVFDFTEIGIPEFLDSGRKSWTLDFAQEYIQKK